MDSFIGPFKKMYVLRVAAELENFRFFVWYATGEWFLLAA